MNTVLLTQGDCRSYNYVVNTVLLTQGDCRSYNYVAALSSEETTEVPWTDVMALAKIIPRICHNINRYTTPLSLGVCLLNVVILIEPPSLPLCQGGVGVWRCCTWPRGCRDAHPPHTWYPSNPTRGGSQSTLRPPSH